MKKITITYIGLLRVCFITHIEHFIRSGHHLSMFLCGKQHKEYKTLLSKGTKNYFHFAYVYVILFDWIDHFISTCQIIFTFTHHYVALSKLEILVKLRCTHFLIRYEKHIFSDWITCFVEFFTYLNIAVVVGCYFS